MTGRLAILSAFAFIAASCGVASTETTETVATTRTLTTSPSVATTSGPLGVPDIVLGGISLIETTFADGTSVGYVVIVPSDFDSTREYPVFLAMPPGAQDAGLTYNVAENWYLTEAVARGWVVISPTAPETVLWFQGSEQYIEEFLDSTLDWLNPEHGLYHLGGASNGGRSAFRILSLVPDRFASVTVYPGYPAQGAETDALADVKNIPFTLWVGGADTPWIAQMEVARDVLEELGKDVTYAVFQDAPHVIPELTDGVEIFDVLDAARR